MTSLSDLPALRGNEGKLLWQQQGAAALRVRQWQRWRWLTLGEQTATLQGLQHLDRPDLPQLPYAVAMLAGALALHQPRSLLNLGLGCGAFERFFRRHFPLTRVTSVERDPAIIEAAQQWFGLASDHPVICGDAAHFVTLTPLRFDLLFCDLHDGNDQALVHAPDFCEQLLRPLGSAGVLVLNLLGVDESKLLSLLMRVRRQLPAVWLIEPPRSSNLVLVAAKQLPALNELPQRAAELKSETGVDLAPYLKTLTAVPLPA
ncbi:hypothetical protein [Motiliproteus sediminis]|uniref:hypothetical protein n=1 Tax=Motiliproteus sediminis TaxID=1468178 RepID=UPI001AEFB88E|nr:hypothetical protein [Motiliproteus sediminis]